MKVLVTGITGFFAPFAVRELTEAGHEVVLFSRKEPPEEFRELKCIQGDINNIRDCLKAMQDQKIETIVHIAAWPTPTDQKERYPDRYDDPDFFPQTMQTNVMGTYNMLEAAVRNGVKHFLLLGSNCMLGHINRSSGRPFPVYYLPIDEMLPSDIEDSYSLSKFIDEEILHRYTRCYGIRTTILRSGWIFDEKMRKEWPDKVKASEKLWDYFNPYVSAEDEAVYIRILLEKRDELPMFGAYFCNADDTLALEPTMELIDKFCPEQVPRMTTILGGYKSFISNQKLKDITGYTPQFSWRKDKN